MPGFPGWVYDISGSYISAVTVFAVFAGIAIVPRCLPGPLKTCLNPPPNFQIPSKSGVFGLSLATRKVLDIRRRGSDN